MQIRDRTPEDAAWIAEVSKPIGGPDVVTKGNLVDLRALPGRIAIAATSGSRSGFLAYHRPAPDWIDIAGLRALTPRQGIGRRLIEDIQAQGAAARLTVETTNDNEVAIAFYQALGFRLTRQDAGAFARILALKGLDPEVPFIGQNGIQITDILHFEMS